MRGIAPTLAALSFGFAGIALAQSNAQPLSVIDWLDKPPQSRPDVKPVALPDQNEPPVSGGVSVPQITVKPLDGNAPRNIGIVPASVTGLPADLWAGSDGAALSDMIRKQELPDLPAAQSLFYTVLLAETAAPQGDDAGQDQLALARVAKLLEFGALDPAEALIEQIGPRKTPAHFALWMDIGLLLGTEDKPCAALLGAPYLSNDYDRRIFCVARAGDYEDASLTFGSAQALKLLDDAKLALLDRFLNPDLFEGEAPLAVPRKMDPLDFRLFETIGDRVPTQVLPRAFAVADLRDVAGWKSQLQAAERLTRSGALPDNRLLGLYTDRQPAASGGIWDRVEALQRFETALRTRSPEAVSKTLPAVWEAMQEAELEVAFANLFATGLDGLPLSGRATGIGFEVQMLSPLYEAAAALPDGTRKPHPQAEALVALARGEAPDTKPTEALATAVYAAFSDAPPRADLITMAQNQQLGEAILTCLDLLQDGMDGDVSALQDALSTLRKLGLEDTARRAALQALLLERSG